MDKTRIVTDEGFLEVFWEELGKCQSQGNPVTQETVFYMLNDLYEQTYGKPKYVSFDAFRMQRNRRIKKMRDCRKK